MKNKVNYKLNKLIHKAQKIINKYYDGTIPLLFLISEYDFEIIKKKASESRFSNREVACQMFKNTFDYNLRININKAIKDLNEGRK